MRAVQALIALSLLSACSDGSSSDFSIPNQQAVSEDPLLEQRLGPAGGTLQTPTARLFIPPGALDRNETLSIQRTRTSLSFGSTLAVGSTYRLGPSGTSFQKPVSVTIPFDPSSISVPDTPAELIGLLRDERTGRVERITPVEVDPQAHTVRFDVPHFSDLQPALLARPLPSGTSLSATPHAILSPGDTVVLQVTTRNRLNEEFAGVPLTLEASGTNHDFGATALVTDANGRAQTTFQAHTAGTKTLRVSSMGQTLATLLLTFNGVPTAQPDTASTDEDSTLFGSGLLDNDLDPQADPLSVLPESTTSALGGSVVLLDDGSYTYTPPTSLQALAATEAATDTFTYHITDGVFQAQGDVSVLVQGRNDLPLLTPDAFSTDEDTPLTGAGLLLNDTDTDASDTLHVVSESVTTTLGVIAALTSTGAFTYDPRALESAQQLSAGQSLEDSFLYRVTDGTAIATAAVRITLQGRQDTPEALSLVTSILQDTPRDLVLRGFDADGDSLSFQISTPPSQGSLSPPMLLTSTSAVTTYTPNPGYLGADTFAFVVSDGTSDSPPTTTTLSVVEPPDPSNLARFFDTNQNQRPDMGDLLIVPFDVPIQGLQLSDLRLPITDDSFGLGAYVRDGPEPHEQTVVLGDDARLRVRGAFTPLDLDPSSPSGIATSDTSPLPRSTSDIVPGFALSSEVGSTFNQQAVAIDLDADGDMDIVSATIFGTNEILLNDGSGHFQSQRFGFRLNTHALAVADMDGDGDLDIVTGNQRMQNWVYFNDGSLDFSRSLPFGTGSDDTTFVTVADMDRDGDLDVLVGNRLLDPDVLYLNDGTGRLDDSLEIAQFRNTRDLLPADLDGDGDLDILAADIQGPDTIFLNDGALGFSDTIPISSNDSRTLTARVADLDHDGDLDIITTGTTTCVYLNQGPRRFELYFTLNGAGSNLELADLDRDGNLDLVVAGFQTTDQIWFNRGSAGFHPIPLGPPDSNSSGLAIADLDRDGDLDIFVGTDPTQGQSFADRIYLNDLLQPSPSFGTEITASRAGTSDLTFDLELGDLDRDGDLDIAVANSPNENFVVFNEGPPAFTFEETLSPNGGARNQSSDVELADMDRDGDLDILVANPAQPSFLLFNDGRTPPSFPANTALPFASATGLTTADMDRDGDLDIITAGFNTPSLLLLNDGLDPPSFPEHITLVTGANHAVRVRAADLNHDGFPDLVFAIDFDVLPSVQSLVLLHLGTDPPSFSTHLFGNGSDVKSIELADMDRDGDLDIIAAHWLDPDAIYFNDGAATPSFDQSYTFPHRPGITFSVHAADVDDDGDQDLIFGDQNGRNVIQYNLDGTGRSFQEFLLGPALVDARAIDTADLDHDGDLDILLADDNDSNIFLLQD